MAVEVIPMAGTVGIAATQAVPLALEFRYTQTDGFVHLLHQLGASLLVSTYQANKLLVARADGGGLSMLVRTFDRPMGMAVDGRRLALGTRDRIWTLRNAPDIAPQNEPAGRHDACYVPRSCHVTGDIGIDDWAWCKGQRYGTIVVDLETSEVIDLLPDRDAATVRAWLEAHPGVELVSRDRASAYSQAATEAAPMAQQVADRWHLLKNVREAVERLFERQLPVITDALKPADPDSRSRAYTSPRGTPDAAMTGEPTPRESPAAPTSPRHEAALAKRGRRVERFERVHELRRRGTPIRQIARDLDMSRRAVRRYLRSERCPDWRPGRATRSWMDAHREWVDARVAEGRINASELHRELAARGVQLSYASVRRYLTKRLVRAGQARPRVNAAKPKPTPPPSPKQLSFDWVRRPEKRTAESQARLDTIRAASSELTIALDLMDEFTALIRKRSTGTLADWLSRAEVSPSPEVRHFAEGIRRDESAVNAAMTLPWSNGPVEGHVNRLKTIKRQMYGRAGFPLLKARVLNAA